ncbi:metallophosphoesterase family protein [Falsiroseomonas oryziterrae]|uniref:metallophosphoesterase family protein n=1 Tax=Falsiroseomonas oryziterrae TaxID=2911368 RepID=UPI001F418E07|nr:metallophosphoesterase family protein [Roseomonas sp. NPKOSM-4]
MKIAILSDIHANREAFEACLADADRRGAQRLVILGDVVGYGADPAWAVWRTMELANAGAIVLRGNHDEAAVAERGGMNPDATAAAAWTRDALDPEAKAFLAALPLEAEEEDRLYVHADAHDPARWHYVRDAEDARRSLDAVQARIVLCGHVHVPALYGLTAAAKLVSFKPVTDVAIPLMRPRRWLAVLGAVGQPRDGDPAAAWAMLDTASSELTIHRVPYDVATAAEKIRHAGLPESLAARLARGR